MEQCLKYCNDFAERVYQRINKVLLEPNYQHDGEDWQVGLIMAKEILDEEIQKL